MVITSLYLQLTAVDLFYSHLVSSSHTGMTDAERDAIDSEAQQYMKVCTDAIRQLKDYGIIFVCNTIH